MPPAPSLFQKALAVREPLLDEKHQSALRLFNGFTEGNPNLVVDLYGRSLVFHNYAEVPVRGIGAVRDAQAFYLAELPWLRAIVLKTRHATTQQEKQGLLLHGETSDRKICENGVWYAIDLTMNRDASFYLDTRNLRAWLKDHLAGKSVLNSFAYTGSLGVAARAGGAARVVQLDRKRGFLNQAKASYTLNGFPILKSDFISADFFPAVSRLKREGQTFDCVLLDPPFFSLTSKGRVDLENDPARLINKARPLVKSGGFLVVINNALFVSGADFMELLDSLCLDGFVAIEKLIPVPEDFIGARPAAGAAGHPTDPAPFNHPTKIAILRIKHTKGQ
ncbi:MAG: class I SAM-dependent methyltransferase [Anaerolineales bacterium]|jgi:23S rRNA (cytosine1962-C5)-methyltransferase|nr:class I SAM-dependent methyltransferase [Anaerolineales bacterium]